MEYLTIEEKTSLTAYLSLLDENFTLLDKKIEQCKELNLSSKSWEELKENAIKALDKIKKQDSLELIEMRKQFEECKH